MSKVTVISDSIISPLGFTSEENFSAVLSGKSGVRVHDELFGVPGPIAASVIGREEFRAEAERRGIVGMPMFETALVMAIEDAVSRTGVSLKSGRTAIVISSIKGNVEELAACPSSAPLSASAAAISSYFENPNAPLVVSNACISGLSALVHARRMLLSGRFDHVVVAGAEIQSKFIVSGFSSLMSLSPEPCRPFDACRIGLNLGEAAAAMVLERSDDDAAGWELVEGATRNDAYHISSPSRNAEGSFRALEYVLGNVSPSELAFVNVHGTATMFNDEMEAEALDRAGLSEVPINSLKGYFGHTMGAAGLLESIISMKAADAGIILPTPGFHEMGVSCPVNISSELRHTDRKTFIKLLSGFGGCNAAMLFRKGGKS